MSYDYNKFQKLCEIKGVNPNMVAKATGVATSTLTNWKKGRYTPKVGKIRIIAEYFHVNEHYFLAEEEREDTDAENGAPKLWINKANEVLAQNCVMKLEASDMMKRLMEDSIEATDEELKIAAIVMEGLIAERRKNV